MNYDDVKELFTSDINKLIDLIRNKTLMEILDRIKIEYYGVQAECMSDKFSRDEIVGRITELIEGMKGEQDG